MINIWYNTSIESGIVRGPRKVIENFKRSLYDCKIEYVINEEKYDKNLFLHWDKNLIEKYFQLKNKENILIGPHIWPFGNDLDVLDKYSNLLFPSQWCVNSCNKFFPHFKATSWPVAIYKPDIVDNIKTDCLVYYKDRSSSDLISVISFLEERNVSYTGLQYGNYTQEEFKESLGEVRYCIIIDNTESQGIAIQEMMASNKPLYVWDTLVWTHLPNYEVEATSVPYWSDECGEKVTTFNEFKENFDTFINKLDNYCPAEYIERNLSPQKSIEILFSCF